MKFFILLILASAAAGLRYSYLLPNSTGNHRWERIEPADLACPVYNNVELGLPDRRDIKEMTVYVPEGYRDKLIEGHICQKIKTTVNCHEHWFSGRDITVETKQVVVSVDECVFEMAQPASVFRVSPPPPDCSYFEDLETSKEEVSITQMDVHYDPYRNAYVSPLLVGGLCKDSPCRASYGRALWIPVKKAETTCLLEKRSIWVEYSDNKTIYHSALHPPKDAPTCKMSFCGRMGVRFSDGEWFYMPTDSGILNDLDYCKNMTVSSYDSSNEINEIDYVDDVIRASRCYDTISRVRAVNALSPWDLSIFNPDRPGLSYGYRVNKGILERALLHYVISASRLLKDDQIGIDLAGSPVYWSDWLPEGTANQTWHGPNGILITANKKGGISLMLPHESIRYSKLNRAYSRPVEIVDQFLAPQEDTQEGLFDLRFKGHTHHRLDLGWTHEFIRSPYLWLAIGLIVLVPCTLKALRVCLMGSNRKSYASYIGFYRPEEVESRSRSRDTIV